jgi:hypothetical protein
MLRASVFLVGMLAIALMIEAKPHSREEPKPALRFNQNGKLKIVNFADLHYGEFPGLPAGKAQDRNSSRVMTDILGYEKPDLVVFTGDLITGDVLLVNATGYIDLLLTPVVQGNYKWASTYGNHDNGMAVTREAIFRTESKYENCYTQHGGEGLAGLTNYYLPVYAPETESNPNPVLILWFFDSRGGFDPSGPKPSTVDEGVVEWFKETNRNITELWGKIPALAFFHIPTLDYEVVQADMANHEPCVGLVDEAVVPQSKDTGFMEALVQSGTVLTTFVGHDHGNGWCCLFKTVEICYNRHTGYGGYGDWTRGARVVELNYPDLLIGRRNYIRFEDGSIVDSYPN